MKWILYFLVISVILAALGLWYLQDPGSITITWLGYEVQFSVIFGFIFFGLFYLFIFCLWRLLYYVYGVLFYGLSFFVRPNHKPDESDIVF